VASSGGSAGTFALPPFAHWLVATVGWRAAYIVFGAGVLLTLAAVARVMRRDPESMGLHPDGVPPPIATPVTPGLSLGVALGTPALWLLAAAFTATWLPVFIPTVHLVSLARDLGHAPATGAWLLSALGAAAVVGRMVMGPVSDRIGRKATLLIAMGLQAAAFTAFAAAQGVPALGVSAVVFGYSYGTVSTMFPAIVGDFFGRAAAGSIVGFLFMLAGSMGAWGPLVAGAVHDATGSYALAFRLAAGANVAAAAILAAARPPRPAGR
jgi:predicted MFS family arabinose efflux permease